MAFGASYAKPSCFFLQDLADGATLDSKRFGNVLLPHFGGIFVQLTYLHLVSAGHSLLPPDLFLRRWRRGDSGHRAQCRRAEGVSRCIHRLKGGPGLVRVGRRRRRRRKRRRRVILHLPRLVRRICKVRVGSERNKLSILAQSCRAKL